MKSILKSPDNAERLLNIVSDTLILLDKNGICVDIAIFDADLWFLNKEVLTGKNLIKKLPTDTRNLFYSEFKKVVEQNIKSTRNYELHIRHEKYFFKCIMQPYNNMVLCQYRDITARSQQKLEMEKKNRELSEVQKVALLGKWTYSSKTTNFSYSGHTQIMCVDKEQYIPLGSYLNIILPEDRDAFIMWLDKNLEGNIEDSIDYRIFYKNTIFYIRLKAFSYENHSNENIILEGYIQNVTDIQKRRNDINLLTHAIDNSTEDVVAICEDGTLLFANRRYKYHQNLGSAEDITTLKIYNISSYVRNIDKWNKLITSVNEDHRHTTFITYNPFPKHPEILAYEGNLYKVTSDQGVKTFWVFGRDISQRIRHEQQIKQFSQVLNKIIENLPAAITVKDIENGYKYLYRSRDISNDRQKYQNAMGKDDFSIYPIEIAQKERKEDIHVATSGEEKHYIIEKRDVNGNPIYLDRRKMRIESNDSPPVLLSIEWNITDLELMKRELLAAKEKAETSDHLKSAFLANMSHEIRTPLNAIVGFSRIIAESENVEERKNYYNIVEANNERLLQLINEILDLSKIESGIVDFNFSSVQLYTLFNEIYDAHVFRCPNGVQLVFEPSDEDICINTDKNRLFQVISNFIGNAFKFTTKGSIRYGYRQESQYILFHVTDTGCGIPQDKIDKIFERFIKANSFAEGTGLGLAICKTIIEKLGGSVSVMSKVCEGTTFYFTLPLKNNLSEAKVQNNKPDISSIPIITEDALYSGTGSDITYNRIRNILIAEDIDSNYILVRSILGSFYHIERAKDGEEAIRIFKDSSPDLILMDIKMPKLSGLEATKIIRKTSSSIPIIALTAFAYEDDRNAVLEAGCNDFLAKPFNHEELEEIINKWIR